MSSTRASVTKAKGSGTRTYRLAYRAPTRLPDGALAVVADDELVPLADTYGDDAHGCRAMRYTREGITAVFEIQAGAPVCVELTLTADAGLTAADLRAVPLDRLARAVYAFAGSWAPYGDDEWVQLIGPAASERDRQRMTQAPQRRRHIDEEFLDRVRKVHAATSGSAGQRLKATADKLSVSPRQAARYIQKAGI